MYCLKKDTQLLLQTVLLNNLERGFWGTTYVNLPPCYKARGREGPLQPENAIVLKAFSHFLQERVLQRPACCFVFSFLNGKDVQYYVLLTLLRAEHLYIEQQEWQTLKNILTFNTSKMFSVSRSRGNRELLPLVGSAERHRVHAGWH